MAPATVIAPDQELNGIHIFRAGSYTLTKADGTKEKIAYSEADVAQIAANANALLAAKMHEPPAKLGHDDDQAFARMAGLPSIGWARRVVAKGMDLFADFSHVPAALAEAIRRGRYRHISSEIYDPEQTKANFGDLVKGYSLRAVAFLGADVPVVKGMNPLMLHEGVFCAAEGGQVITLEVPRMDHADKGGALMVNANRHPMDALVSKKGVDAKLKVHAKHPDNTYDAHDIKTGEVHKGIPHDDLTLLSEKFNPEEDMEAIKLAEKEIADGKTALLAEQAKTKALLAKITDDKVNAFAEKHKATLKQPPVLAAFKALAKLEIEAPVKLAEGKETPYLEAFMAFAESLIAAKPVLFGELAPITKEGEVVKNQAVKLAEDEFKTYAETHGNPGVAHASLAVAARELAEKDKITYRVALLKVAAGRLGKYVRGQYAEIELTEVA